MMFKLILLGLSFMFRFALWRSAVFRDRLQGKKLTVQICTADGAIGRQFIFDDGKFRSRPGVSDQAGLSLVFKTAEIGARLLMPPIDQLEQIEAMKNFLFIRKAPMKTRCGLRRL